jgi:hypothetical protein
MRISRHVQVDLLPNQFGWTPVGVSRWLRYGWALASGTTIRASADPDMTIRSASELARYRQVGPVLITKPFVLTLDSLVN